MARSEEWLHLGIVDGDVKVQIEHVTLESFGCMIGALQVAAGVQFVKRGMDIEDVKNVLWDLYDGAIAALEDSLRKEDVDGKEIYDSQREKGKSKI